MHKVVKWICYAVFIVEVGSSALLTAQNTVFERKKQEYLDTEGSQSKYFGDRMWTWLEKIKLGQINPSTYRVKDIDGVEKPVLDVVHNIIRCWGTYYGEYDAVNYPPYDTAWRWAAWNTSVACIWILLKYGDVIYPDDKNFLTQLYNDNIRSRDFGAGSENSRLCDMVGRYLYSQYYKDVQVQYSYNPPPTENIYPFTWEGRTYSPGNTYSAYELSRDWLHYHMNQWVLNGNAELDSPNYTYLFVLAFTAVYEMAQDPVMKQKAKMMLDFLLLESVVDYSANQWGGALGRVYVGVVYGGDSRFYWSVFWDEIPQSHDPDLVVLLSSYRLPDVIYDIGDLRDEPDNYYHINMEYNWNIVNAPGTGKWNYVTKFYNLGGRIGTGWQLNIKSEDPIWWNPKRPGVPFRMWINDTPGIGDVDSRIATEAYCTLGYQGYQYKNAMWVRGAQVHYAIGMNKWDVEEKVAPWEFLKEGRTMIALQVRTTGERTSGFEVAIEGVDYPTYNAFKKAVMDNASLGGEFYQTSRGDRISWMRKTPDSNDFYPAVLKNGETNWQFVWPFPFPRIQTQDWRGQWIVRWSGNCMTVTKHGKQLIYNFNNWAVQQGDAPVDTQAPAIPTNFRRTSP